MQEQGSGRGQKYERDMYYRRPREGENAGWITFGPSLSGTSLRDFTMRGFEPLHKFGTIPHGETNPWRPILSHPDGPAEFPVDQVLTLRWYSEPPIPGVKFPQISGTRIREFRCPECSRPPFVEVDGIGAIRALGNHLRIMHGWDRSNLDRYGESVGINFNDVPAVTEIITEVTDAPTCDECGFTAKNSFGLQAHMKAHKEPEVVTT